MRGSRKMTIRSLTRILAAALFLLPLLKAADAPLAADTYLSGAAPASNFGNAVTLNIAPGNAALVRFDLSGIPSGSTVSKVNLRVFVDKVTTAGTLSYALVTSPWTETGVTLNTAPTTSAAFATSPVNLTNSFVLVDVTTQVQVWLANPATN